MYTAERRSGSIVIYVIVGVLLAALAVGAVIVAQHRGSQQIASRPAGEPTQQRDEAPTEENTTDEDEEQAEKEAAEKKAADEKAAQEEAEAEKRAEQKRIAEEEAAKKEAESEASDAPEQDQSGPMAQAGGPQTASNLPTTGPVEDTLGMVVGMVAIFGAGYFYYHATRRS
ncbi:MAG: hypothetical protein UY35_C0028G0010 [Candidatus Saccharibacteria bacterium GW2011_GWC2_48_9]|nr:MAG: hypothetical protein UY35_C0028G0010 [Candidatus Saccharibacteria bacterium GW2011_GWC2_48_9]